MFINFTNDKFSNRTINPAISLPQCTKRTYTIHDMHINLMCSLCYRAEKSKKSSSEKENRAPAAPSSRPNKGKPSVLHKAYLSPLPLLTRDSKTRDRCSPLEPKNKASPLAIQVQKGKQESSRLISPITKDQPALD